jgi:hypothetical protein
LRATYCVLRLRYLSQGVPLFQCIVGWGNAMFATQAAYTVAHPRDKMWVVPGLVRVNMATCMGFWVGTELWGLIFLVRFAKWGNTVSWAQPRDVDQILTCVGPSRCSGGRVRLHVLRWEGLDMGSAYALLWQGPGGCCGRASCV